jgi:ABC-2 type transport system ATP-binding protein
MSSSSTAPALRVSQLHKSYATGKGREPVPALAGVDFEVEPGSVFALLGPNGAGKSTTVRILATLTRADRGTAQVAGVDVAVDPQEVRRRIGLVSQRPSSDPNATGRENLELAARIHGMARSDACREAERLLRRFDLEEAADRLVRTWSGGMGRKLDVAIGLVHAPSVLFLDEPTTGLDPEARADLWAEIARLAREAEMTVLLTTHYLDEADRLADRLAIVDGGRIKVEGTPDGLKSELRGDTVAIDLADPRDAGAAQRVVEALGCSEVTVLGASLRARSDEGARMVPLVCAALDERGVGVAGAGVARPSLDDVYLLHVGRTFRAEQGAVA